MKIFGRTKSPKPGAVINGEYIPDAVQPSRSGRWLGILWRFLLVVLVLLLIYLAYLFLKDIFGSNKSDTGKKTTGQGQVNAPGQSSTTAGSELKVSSGGSSSTQLTNNSKQQSGGSSSSSTGSSSSSSGSSSSANKSASSNQNLSNSGPGDVVAIFVATSAAGALIYQIKIRRNLSAAE